MTDDTHRVAIARNHLLEAARAEMIKFEHQESAFRRRDREERAAELNLRLGAIEIH